MGELHILIGLDRFERKAVQLIDKLEVGVSREIVLVVEKVLVLRVV